MKRILVLDDDESVCDTLEDALTYCKFHVKTSRSPNDILHLIKDYDPDILLVDYLLQSTNGIELCHRIKDNINTNVPVVMISAYASELSCAEADEFDAILHKPFSLDELLQTVNELIDK